MVMYKFAKKNGGSKPPDPLAPILTPMVALFSILCSQKKWGPAPSNFYSLCKKLNGGQALPDPPPPHRRCYVPDLSWWKIIRNFSFFFGKHTARDDWLHVQNVECGVVKSKEGVDGGWNRVLRHFFTSNFCHIDGRIQRGVGVFRRKVLQLQCIFFECNWRLMYVTVYVRIACLTLKMAAFTYIYTVSVYC